MQPGLSLIPMHSGQTNAAFNFLVDDNATASKKPGFYPSDVTFEWSKGLRTITDNDPYSSTDIAANNRCR